MFRQPIIEALIWIASAWLACGEVSGWAQETGNDSGASQSATSATETQQQPAHKALSTALEVDWATQVVTLRATGDADVDVDPSAAFRPLRGSDCNVRIKNDEISVQGRSSELLAALEPGTRSIWLQSGAHRLRLDLTAIELHGVAARRAESAHAGPTITLRTGGLWPGFRVLCASQPEPEAGTEPLPSSPAVEVRERDYGFPRLLKLEPGEKGAQVRVQFAQRDESAPPLAHILTLVNPDGSRTPTLKAVQRGNAFEKSGDYASPGRSAPIDAPVQTPTLALLTAPEAFAKATAAGLQPVLIDLNRLEEIDVDEHQEDIVLRQGWAPGVTARQGDWLLLGVRPANADGSLGAFAPDDFSADISDTPPLIVGDPFGFAPIALDAGPIRTGRDDASSHETTENDDFTPPLDIGQPSDAGTMIATDPDLPENTATNSTADSTEGHDQASADGAVTVLADPGVCLDPTVQPQDNAASGLLKVVLQALIQRLDAGHDLPGVMGRALNDIVKQFEAELTNAARTGRPLDQWPIEGVVSLLVSRLNISLTETAQRETADAWRQSVRPPAHLDLLDRNRNGLVSDDLVLWLLAHLHRQRQFDPATTMQLVSAPLGNQVAVLPGKLIGPGWIATLTSTPSGLTGGTVSPANASGSGTAGGLTLQAGDGEIDLRIPKGQAKVVLASTPTNVRVPTDLVNQPLSEVLAKIRGVGLTVDKQGKFFEKDKVTGATPQEGTWVRPGDAIALSLQREVPQVEKLTAKEATQLLEKKEFDPVSDQQYSYRTSDTVIEQTPKHPEMHPRGSTVTLVIRRYLPDVEKKAVGEAQAELLKRGFDPKADEKYVYRSTDIVAEQSPRGDQYVTPDTQVTLVVKRPVPSVTGLQVTQALAKIKAAGFTPGHGEDIHAEDIVEQQSPPARQGEAVVLALPGERITIQEVATLVPDLTGSSSLDAGRLDPAAKTLRAALELLSQRKLKHEVVGPNTDYPAARVVQQVPAAGQRMDRRTGKVQLRLVTPLPDLSKGTAISVAQQRLLERDLQPQLSVDKLFDADVLLDYAVSDRVFSSGPDRYLSPQANVRLKLGRAVPSLDKEPWTTAMATLERHGLRSQLASGHSPGQFVHHTAPAGGEIIDPSRPVSVYPGAKVPPVEDQPLEVAQRLIHDAGLAAHIRDDRPEPTEDASRVNQTMVLRQSPPAGSIVLKKATTSVALDVVRYGEALVTVPAMEGRSVDAAQREAQLVGLDIRKRSSSILMTPSREMDGVELVERQFTAAGTRVKKGEVIDVSVTLYRYAETPPELVAVPLVSGGNPDLPFRPDNQYFTVGRAIDIVRQARLTPIIVYRGQQFNEDEWAAFALLALLPSPELQGDLRLWNSASVYHLLVRTQEPAAQSEARVGDKVFLNVWVWERK
jgi:beta-lactam-binding protein with PASTA domain